MPRKVGHWALIGLEMQARATAASRSATHDTTGMARSRLVRVLYYPLSRRLAYHGRDGVIAKHVALMELEKEARLDGFY